MVKSNVDVLRAAYGAFARGDLATVLASLDPAVEWESSEPAGGRFHGLEAVAHFFQGLSGFYAELRVEPETFVAEGDRVVVLGRHRGRAKETGAAIDVPFAHAWRMRNGKATHFFEYTDTATLVRATTGSKVAV